MFFSIALAIESLTLISIPLSEVTFSEHYILLSSYYSYFSCAKLLTTNEKVEPNFS
jgi:hypothetical protein